MVGSGAIRKSFSLRSRGWFLVRCRAESGLDVDARVAPPCVLLRVPLPGAWGEDAGSACTAPNEMGALLSRISRAVSCLTLSTGMQPYEGLGAEVARG